MSLYLPACFPSFTSRLSSLSLSACKAAFKCCLFEQGVKLKVYSNKPVFASLSSHIYQYTLISFSMPVMLLSKMSSLFDQGVRLKGYSNAPVFASLSALIYQHTLISLALCL
jgi:hypothetical protein